MPGQAVKLVPNELQKIIPLYNGDKRQLNLFLRKCEYIIHMFRGDATQDEYIMQLITSRLTDAAAALISEREDIGSWTEFKNLLIQHFGDPRSEECIGIELESLRIKSGEPYLDFCHRIQTVRSCLFSKVNLITSDSMRQSKIIIYNQVALNVFLYNLPENMVRIVRLKVPKTLEDALSIVLEEVNFHEQYSSKNKSSHSMIPKAVFPSTPSKFNNNLPNWLQNHQGFKQNPQYNTYQFGIPQGKAVLPQPQFGYRPPQFGNHPTQFGYHPSQIGYRPPQFGYRPPQFGYRPPLVGYKPTGLQPLPPMRPQQFGQQQTAPRQVMPQKTWSNDVSMRTAPPMKQGLRVNEIDLYDDDQSYIVSEPYYEEDPYSSGYTSYIEDPSLQSDTVDDCTQSLYNINMSTANLNNDQSNCLHSQSDKKSEHVGNFCIRASTDEMK